MRRKSILLIALGVFLVTGIAYAVTSRPELFYSGEEVHGPRPAPNCRELTPPCPAIQPATSLAETWAEEAIAYRFEPPPEGASPPVGTREAVDIAWQEGGASATSQQATLVMIPEAVTSQSTFWRGSSVMRATASDRRVTPASRTITLHAGSSRTSR